MHNILSVQSHVAYGYVGNKAAIFPLQRLGNEAWFINTVQFSNHTGYGSWQGEVFSSNHIKNVYEGIKQREILSKCDAILSGYMGDASIASSIVEIVSDIKSLNPKAIYCCDPVMGDTGRGFFIKEGIFELFRDKIIKISDIITPNQFEACALTNMSINNLEDAKKVAAELHKMGPRIILITSLIYNYSKQESIENLVYDGVNFYLIVTPFFNFSIMPNGCGDLVTSLFLHHYLINQKADIALSRTISSVYGILKHTYQNNSRELMLISAQEELVNPSKLFICLNV